MSTENFIDIRKLVASKSPKLAKFIPGFVYSYLKRILHQDEVNDFMRRNGELKDAEFCSALVEDFQLKIDVEGIENIPNEGGVILAMNHPLGGMDAMALVHALKHKRKDIRFIVNDLLMNLKPLEGLFVGVNKHGVNERKLHTQMTELFESDKVIGIFPAGLVSRKKNGVIRDLEWKKTFVRYAKRHDKLIVPVYIDGRLTNFFYNLSNFRTFLGLKVNLEMLYLSDEMYQQKGKHIRFVIGKPIALSDFHHHESQEVIANKIKESVYQLGQQLQK
jgi:putative hemolysin